MCNSLHADWVREFNHNFDVIDAGLCTHVRAVPEVSCTPAVACWCERTRWTIFAPAHVI